MISVQTEDFDAGKEAALLRRHLGIGAVVSFIGLVREFAVNPDACAGLYIEHYPGMTEKSLQGLATQAQQRWSLSGVRVIHRVGQLAPGEQIVLVITAAAHRKDAFAACEWLMDMLKTQAPFWKREGDDWVAAKDSDQAALKRWGF
ncbi:MAG TPA: molybdenum cofactor biosynthesis protein MoaE [Cellvibrionaceae bacterium]|nr:molybdenum cofactor biosynthesis protein MoaE [Cellvibrionaceae bacterium]HMW49487.1 molybdenum cofactor biosynthesis protein MoaE [Cellvibrionaceae bacterium]HMW71332.1 molybdenum cofactor biosynthesis protein MoaE [Cellvibrionaceae bacterium]HMY40637.1 molybdenum cofactor biosynthesis protein MoaE [Marinagarivorans sp.]HNG61668.1 molybdenum cofactor biosynthesis protein MoaE [Cellvibrionaceae bacterium]